MSYSVDPTPKRISFVAGKIDGLSRIYDLQVLTANDTPLFDKVKDFGAPVSKCDADTRSLCWAKAERPEQNADNANGQGGSYDSRVQFELRKNQMSLTQFDHPIAAQGIAPSSEDRIVFPEKEGIFALYRVGKTYEYSMLSIANQSELKGMAFAPTNFPGRYFATLDPQGRVRVYDVAEGRFTDIPKINGPFYSLALYVDPNDGSMLPRAVTRDREKTFSWRPFGSRDKRAAFDLKDLQTSGAGVGFEFGRRGETPRAMVVGKSWSSDGCCEARRVDGMLLTTPQMAMRRRTNTSWTMILFLPRRAKWAW